MSCPENYTLKFGASGIIGNDHSTCCDPLCIGYDCPIGYVSKSSGSSRVGNDRSACCEEKNRARPEEASANAPGLVAIVFVFFIGCVVACVCIVALLLFRNWRFRRKTPEMAP